MKIDWTLKSLLDYRFIGDLEFEVYGKRFHHDGAPDCSCCRKVKVTASVSLERKTPDDGLYPASAEDYAQWLRGYVKNGGKVTHHYDYPFSRARFLYASEDVTVDSRKEYGARSRSIIARKGVKVTRSDPSQSFDGWGHTKVYWLDGYRANDTFVPVYSDAVFDEFRKKGKK
jgi:hypothetical protein